MAGSDGKSGTRLHAQLSNSFPPRLLVRAILPTFHRQGHSSCASQLLTCCPIVNLPCSSRLMGFAAAHSKFAQENHQRTNYVNEDRSRFKATKALNCCRRRHEIRLTTCPTLRERKKARIPVRSEVRDFDPACPKLNRQMWEKVPDFRAPCQRSFAEKFQVLSRSDFSEATMRKMCAFPASTFKLAPDFRNAPVGRMISRHSLRSSRRRGKRRLRRQGRIRVTSRPGLKGWLAGMRRTGFFPFGACLKGGR